jgi:hypothetical protein
MNFQCLKEKVQFVVQEMRGGLKWFKAGTWKLRGLGKDLKKGNVFYVGGKKIFCIYY